MNPTGTNGGNAWTSEQVQELTRLVGEGFSAGQIARDMGVHTRNSIIGKIHRLGLKLARLPTQSNVPRPKSQKPSVPGNRNGDEPIAPTPLKNHATPPECAPMLLLDAGMCNCRWADGPWTGVGRVSHSSVEPVQPRSVALGVSITTVS